MCGLLFALVPSELKKCEQVCVSLLLSESLTTVYNYSGYIFVGFVLTGWEIVIFASIYFVSMRYSKHTYVFVGEIFV